MSQHAGRPAVSSACRLDIPVPESPLEHVIALATLHGMTKAEYARMVMERHVYGELAMIRTIALRQIPQHGSNEG